MTRHRTHRTTLVISLTGGRETEIVLHIRYTVSPYIEATHIDPAEGGDVQVLSVLAFDGTTEIAGAGADWIGDIVCADTILHETLRAEWADAEAADAERAAEDRRERAMERDNG